LTIQIDKAVLEEACKGIIETILFCLPDALKGTVYRIGKPPDMNAIRITSGIIDEKRENISWGLPGRSDYNPPGKPWAQYRDENGRALEAMAWCVERQKSWTSETPREDARSVRLQVEGVWEDYHHMEPVLIRKEDLYPGNGPVLEYPEDTRGGTLWQDSEYVVVAVIKIHFKPNTIKIRSGETKIIKKLSRALGTELLSYQLRQHSVEAMHQLTDDKIDSCNILADSLRNAITKSGLIFSLIKLELGVLRKQWEGILLEHSDQREMQSEAVQALNKILLNMNGTADKSAAELIDTQTKFLDLSFPPERGENWVRMQIEEKWNKLISMNPLGKEQVEQIRRGIEQLKKSLYLGKDPDILEAYDKIPASLKMDWVDLIYKNTDSIDLKFVDEVTDILEQPFLNLPFKEKSRRSLVHLRALAEIISQLEENTNVVLRKVLNGSDNGTVPAVPLILRR